MVNTENTQLIGELWMANKQQWTDKDTNATNMRSDSSGIKPLSNLESSYFFNSSIFNEIS